MNSRIGNLLILLKNKEEVKLKMTPVVLLEMCGLGSKLWKEDLLMKLDRWWMCWPRDIRRLSCRLRMREGISYRGCSVCDKLS